MRLKSIIRLNKISQNIRNFGTSPNLFDVAIRDRPTVKKILFPLGVGIDKYKKEDETLPFPLINPHSRILAYWRPVLVSLFFF